MASGDSPGNWGKDRERVNERGVAWGAGKYPLGHLGIYPGPWHLKVSHVFLLNN